LRNNDTHQYSAYGLRISSALALPELTPISESPIDVTITVTKIDWSPPAGVFPQTNFSLGSDQAHLCWHEVGKFLVQHGREILIEPFPGVEEAIIRLPLLGLVFTILLHQRGFLVLHGSAVSLNGQGIIFLGDKGSGKSSLAASFYASGHQLVSDDVVAIDLRNSEKFMLLPSFPQIKLWPEAIAPSLQEDPDMVPQLHSKVDKRARKIMEGFSQQPLPLEHVFVLGWNSATEIYAMHGHEAMLQIIANSFLAHGALGKSLLDNMDATNFFNCARLAGKIPVSYLERPLSLELLPSMPKLIQEYLMTQGNRSSHD
jgi:hypothetical protein